MKKSTQRKIKKATDNAVLATQEATRTIAATALALGRGIARGAQEGLDDVRKLDKSKTRTK